MYCDFIVTEAFQSKGFKSHLANCDLYYCDLRLFAASLITIICIWNKCLHSFFSVLISVWNGYELFYVV